MKFSWAVLDKVAEKLGLKIRSCGDGHFRVEGGKYEVNYYPDSRQRTIYVKTMGMSATIKYGSWEKAFEFANILPREGFIRAHERSRRKPMRWEKKFLFRSGNLCYLCGKILSLDTATVDHFIPISKGGTNEIENLRLACKECNKNKGNKLLPEDVKP